MKRFKTWKQLGTDMQMHRVMRESDYRKIMAVYRAASIVSSFVIISPFMGERLCDAIEALDIAIERAEK